MISKKKVSNLIDRIETEYAFCWKVLEDIKSELSAVKDEKSTVLTASVEDIIDFQPRLATALYDLDKIYNMVSSEEKYLIKRKNQLSDKWFRGRMRILKNYRDILKQTIVIGKDIGDAFAWIFYIRERKYLEKHFEHEPITHIPMGIGGIGEIEFLKQTKAIGHQLIIYHGTTTFLRVGDVSFFDMRSLRLTALGEIKSEKVGPNEVRIGLYLAGLNINDDIFPVSSPMPYDDNLPDSMRQRLKRQLEAMSNALEYKKSNWEDSIIQAGHVEEMKLLAEDSIHKMNIYRKLGDGLIVMAFKYRNKRSLASILMEDSQKEIEKISSDFLKGAWEILDKTSTDNSLCTGFIRLNATQGTTPIFWWDLPSTFIRELYFRKTYLFTIYNPLHLVRKLRAAGFEVNPINNHRSYKVSKKIGQYNLSLEHFNYFLGVIQGHLMKEEVVIHILNSVLKKAEAGEIQPDSRIDLRILLDF